MPNQPESLQLKLSHHFNNTELLSKALTHRSAAKNHNERLEFLGDSVLGFLVAEFLYEKYPESSEGELSRMRASLVNKPSLAWIARKLELGSYLQMGTGERSSGGSERDSNLSNAIEAIIAAIYLDGGMDSCRVQVQAWVQELLLNLETVSEKDPKTQLQELMQSQGLKLPTYEVTSIAGEAHDQSFTVSCTIETVETSQIGQGRSKREAEQQAAKKMLANQENSNE